MTIQDFIEAEQMKMSWWDKVIRNYPRVHQTSFLNNPVMQPEDEIVLKPSVIRELIIIPFSLMGLLLLYSLFRILIHNKLGFFITLGLILFILFFLCMAIWHTCFNPKLIYQIRINHKYIEAHHHRCNWENISDTALLFKMGGKIENMYLVLIMRDGNVEKLNLTEFRISPKKVSGIIEYYKVRK